MRTKEEILKDAVKAKPAPGSWDCVASLHERLIIEVLIDIRDALKTFVKHHQDHWEEYHGVKGGDGNDKY